MAVTTRTRSSVQVNVWARSTTWVANELPRVLMEVVNRRGLPVDYMHRHLELFERGFRTWLTGRWLEMVTLEIYEASTERLVEKFALEINYDTVNAADGGERFQTNIDKITDAIGKLKALSADVKYRVVARLTDNAPKLPGWQPTKSLDDAHLKKTDIGNVIDTAKIGTTMAYYFDEGSDEPCK